MVGLTVYIWMVYLMSAFVTGTSEEQIYIRSHKGMAASKFVLKSETVTNVIDCLLICQLNDNTLSVQYNNATGLCRCHSVIPQSLDLQEETNSDIYYSPSKLVLVPFECMSAEGYIFDLKANFCFKVHLDMRAWVDAQAQCVSEGGTLAKLDTQQKRNIANTFVIEDGTTDYYIGGTDTAEDGIWRWIADDSIIPDMTMEGRKDCLEINYGELYYDDSTCDNWSQRYVCEIGI